MADKKASNRVVFCKYAAPYARSADRLGVAHIFESFADLGLKASGTGLSSADLRPGRIGQVGIDAGRPILD
jgi:hypothetical protein